MSGQGKAALAIRRDITYNIPRGKKNKRVGINDEIKK